MLSGLATFDQPVAKLCCQRGMKRQDIFAAIFGVARFHSDGWRVDSQVETPFGQTGEFGRSQAREERREVEHLAAFASETAILCAGFRRLQEPAEFLTAQGSPFTSNIHAGIHSRQVGERVFRAASGPHEPVAERLHRDQKVIAARNAQTGDDVPVLASCWLPPIGQPVRNATGLEVRQPLESAGIESVLNTVASLHDVPCSVPLRFQVSFEVRQVLGERSFAMIFKRVDVPPRFPSRSLCDFREPLLRRVAVIAERYCAANTNRPFELPAPGVGLLFDFLRPRRPLGDSVAVSVQVANDRRSINRGQPRRQ